MIINNECKLREVFIDMSLVTCVDLDDKISLMSDGLMTDKDGGFHDNGFKKFLLKNNFFLAITNSHIVAEAIFNDIEKKNITSYEIKEYIGSIYREINKEFNIVLGVNENDRFSYSIYTHFSGEHELIKDIYDLGGYPLVMHSSNIDESFVLKFKKEIKMMHQKKLLNDDMVQCQKNFHKDVANFDSTVNEELFWEYFIKP